MDDPIIQFFSEEIDFSIPDEDRLRAWLEGAADAEGQSISFLNFVFCSDEYLLEMNRQYLDHDDYTDVITFPYAEAGGAVEGDVFISIDRVRENASSLGNPFGEELRRVMVHGLLHLLGYEDKNPASRSIMSSKEDYYLSLLAE